MIRQSMKRRAGISILALGMLCLPMAAQGPKASSVDYALMRSSIQRFENAVWNASSATFGQLGILGKPKGVYLQGYGYMYSVLVNPRWGRITSNTPFGQLTSGTDLSPEDRKARLDAYKDQLVAVLFHQGNALPQLDRDKYITIAAFIEESNPEGTVNTTIVLSVLKSDIDELGNKSDRYNEFKQRVKIVEY